MTHLDEITKGVYRIGQFWPEHGITINQFLVVDERSALVHTGTHQMYDDVRKAVAKVIDPARLAYVVVPHFEADECGGIGRFVRESKDATLLCSDVGKGINLSGWDYSGPVRGVRDGDVIELGEHRLRFLETPHVHHWDSMMVFEESTKSLFPADLFIQPGEQTPVVREDLGKEMCELYRGAGIFAAEKPVIDTVNRIERLRPQWVHPMHGGSLPSDTFARYAAALRRHPFAYDGRLFGRAVPMS